MTDREPLLCDPVAIRGTIWTGEITAIHTLRDGRVQVRVEWFYASRADGWGDGRAVAVSPSELTWAGDRWLMEPMRRSSRAVEPSGGGLANFSA